MEKCKYWTRGECRGYGYEKSEGLCPKNTDTDCNIIPAKKPRMARVKAWGFVAFGRCTSASIDRDGTFNKPCTILIDRKHLKEAK